MTACWHDSIEARAAFGDPIPGVKPGCDRPAIGIFSTTNTMLRTDLPLCDEHGEGYAVQALRSYRGPIRFLETVSVRPLQ